MELECSAEWSGHSVLELEHSAVLLERLVVEPECSVVAWAHSVAESVPRSELECSVEETCRSAGEWDHSSAVLG